MLTVKERHEILLSLQHCHQLSLYPTQVCTLHWKLQPGADKRWKAWIFHLNYGLLVAHVLYKNLTLVYTLLVLSHIPLHQILIHAVLAAFGVMNSFFYYVLHYQYAHDNAAFVRMTLTGDLARG